MNVHDRGGYPVTYANGDLVELPADAGCAVPRCGMVVTSYTTLYGGEFVDVCYADRDAGTDGEWLPLIVAETLTYAWNLPRSYSVAELAPYSAERSGRNAGDQ